VIHAKTGWSRLVSVCAKCDGDGKSLARALKSELKRQGVRGVRVTRSTCLDVCPKRAVAVAVSGPGGNGCVVVRSSDEAPALATAVAARG
jgi:hypothetical protein